MKISADIYFKSRSIIKLFGIFILLLVFVTISCAPRAYVPSRGYAVVSWYGPDFHGKLTASGERFDMNSLTCAHKSYPFGTILKLTNVKNGQSVKVTVNDRGPFVRGRDIDVSRAAAKKLGIMVEGTGKVRIEHIGRDMRYRKYLKEATISKTIRKGPFTIQVGAFVEESNATHMKESLALNHNAVYMRVKWIDGKKFYRVRVGNFKSENQAISFASQLAEEGYDADVVPYEL